MNQSKSQQKTTFFKTNQHSTRSFFEDNEIFLSFQLLNQSLCLSLINVISKTFVPEDWEKQFQKTSIFRVKNTDFSYYKKSSKIFKIQLLSSTKKVLNLENAFFVILDF